MDRVDSMEEAAQHTGRGAGPRHSILDLAPLELECLSILWPMGEGTVREIHRQLSIARPRAYTTVLTIMDRLAQKGIVARRKLGRAYRYRANLSADEARGKAVEKIVAGFFEGSAEALAAHLSLNLNAINSATHHPLPGVPPAAVERTSTSATLRSLSSPAHAVIDATDEVGRELLPRALDETLL